MSDIQESPSRPRVEIGAAHSAKNSQAQSAERSASATDLLALASKMDSMAHRGLLLLLISMVFSLAIRAVVSNKWLHVAVVPIFATCSLILTRYGNER